jgi:two-component sensor histidine kinase/PAS domain-containing protein
MIVNIQIGHAFVVLAAFLAVISGMQYLKYRTPITRCAGLFLFCLAGELFSFSFLLIKDPTTSVLFWQIMQAIFFFSFVVFWSMFIIGMAGFSKKANWWIVISIFCTSAIAILVFQGEPLPVHSPFGLLTNMPPSFFNLPEALGQPGRYVVGLFYGIGTVCSIFLLRYLLNSEVKFRNLILPLFIGNIFFYAVSIFEHVGIDPFLPFHLTQLALIFLSCLIFLFAVVWRFGGILPISRESVFEGLHDAVLLLDWQNCIIDVNQSAQNILGVKRSDVIRKPLSMFWPLGERLIKANPGKEFISEECMFTLDEQEFTFGVNITNLLGVNQSSMGSLVVLRNITSRDRMEVVLSEQSSEIQRTNAILATLAEVNINIHHSTDLTEINAVLGDGFKKLGLICCIVQFDPGSDELTIKYISSKPEVFARIEKLIGKNVIGLQLDRNQFARLYRILDLNKIKLKKVYPSFLAETPGKISTRLLMQAIKMLGVEMDGAILALPLVTRKNALGVICVWGGEIRESDVVPFRLFADQIANVMDRAALYEKEIQRSTELSRVNNLTIALSEVASVISATENSKIVLNTLGRELKKAGLDCVVGRIDMRQEAAYLSYLSFNSELIQGIEKLIGLKLENFAVPRKYWPGSKIIEDQEPAWYSGARQIFGRLFTKIPKKAVSKALDLLNVHDEDFVCFLPLIQKKETVGVLAIWGPELREEDDAILSVFSSQVASIIQNISSLEHQVQKADELKRTNAMIIALSRVAAQLDTMSDLNQVFTTLGEELLTVQISCMVGVLNDTKDNLFIEHVSLLPAVVKSAQKMGTFWPDHIAIPRRLWPAEKVVSNGVPFWDTDPVGSARRMFPFVPKIAFEKAFEFSGIDSDGQICYLPMINNEDVIGVLAMWGANLKHADLPALSVFANQVAISVNNIRLYNQAQKEIDDRKLAEARIRETLEEKEILLKEVHHRVKNNLQVISSLLNLQLSETSDEETADILLESQNRVRSMALIHEKLYQSSDLARIDLNEYLHSLVNSLTQTYRNQSEPIAVKVKSDDIALTLDTAIPCGLIVNELVSNSLKYAFPEGISGKVDVSCREIGKDRYRLSIQDNGIGLPDGFDVKSVSSLGLKLVVSLVRQIDGEFRIDGKRGTLFDIEFSEVKTV